MKYLYLIPKAIPTFFRSASTAKLVWKLSDFRVNGKPKMVAITGSTYEITQYLRLSLCMR